MKNRFNLNISALLLISGFFAACAPSVKRIGYDKPKQVVASCPVQFSKPGLNLELDSHPKLGEVKVRDNGFTFNCTESDILDIIRTETCSLGGNLAVIKNEKTPDWLSSCYRAEADILKMEDTSSFTNKTEYYSEENIGYRSARNSATQSAMMIGVIVGGVVAGLMFSK